jgi:hypothetical protein
MDATTSHKPGTVGIIYGFAEGGLTGYKLRKALRKAGFGITNAEKADIIIAHSGGYLVLPHKLQARTILYVGANTWDQPLPASLKQKLHYDYTDRKAKGQLLTWLLHGLRNDMYILRIPHTFRLARGYRSKPSQPPTVQRTIVVRNQYDSYCTGQALLNWFGITTYLSLDGGHDDIWNNPDRYVDVIQSLYRGY